VLRFDKFKPTIKNSKYGRIKKRVSLAGGDHPELMFAQPERWDNQITDISKLT